MGSGVGAGPGAGRGGAGGAHLQASAGPAGGRPSPGLSTAHCGGLGRWSPLEKNRDCTGGSTRTMDSDRI